ncbi:MAG: lipase family protein [Rhodoglobus sp.]
MRLGSFLIRQAERLRRLPWVARLVLGLAVVAVGALVLVNPFQSLTALVAIIALALVVDGAARIGRYRSTGLARLQLVAGLIEIVAAIAIVAWPFISVGTLALVVGVSLIVSGVVNLVHAATHGDRRLANLLLGLAFVIFGVLVIVWPDVSLIVISVAFAVRMLAFGVMVVVRAIRYRENLPPQRDVDEATAAARPTPRLLRGLDLAGRVLLLVLALISAAGSVYLHQQLPEPSAFYNAPESVPATAGKLISSEPYTQSVPNGSRGWLILYTTTDVNDKPRVASAFVIAPDAPSDTPRDVVLWDHGTEGADRQCAPTVLPPSSLPFPFTAPIAALKQQLQEGRVLVGPDYPGMGTAGAQSYLIGENEGRSALDAVLAAHQLTDLSLSNRTVVWGHSQGGQAAIWTGQLAADYAPDLEILGVAAAAPAADAKGLISTFENSTIGKVLGPFVIRAFSETYADVDALDYVDPRMFAIYDAASRRCFAGSQTAVTALTVATMYGPMYTKDPSTGPLGERLDQNKPTGPIAAPLFIAQGAADPLILPKVQEQYIKDRCDAGQALRYEEYAGRDHLSVVADDSPFSAELLTWTDDRFAGKPQQNTCG